MSRLVRAVLAMIMIIAVGGCTDDPRPVVDQPDWSEVALPSATIAPSRLTTDGLTVAVGGRDGDGPWIGVIDQDQLRTIPLTPNSPYAEIAEIVSLGIYGDELVALGNVHGGAHGNSRWTVWRGDTGGLIEEPQSLGVFGGTDGGDLVEIMINSGGPMIIGSRRFDADGLDPAVWLPEGDDWQLQPSTGTDLDGTHSLQLSVRGGTARTDQMILVGSALRLGDGVSQQAAGWLQSDPWQRFPLPGPGERSEATAVACAPPGPRAPACLATGSADGSLAGWWLSDDARKRQPAVQSISGLPATPVSPTGAPPRGMITADVTAIAYQETLLIDTAAGWQSLSLPAGRVIDAVAIGPTIYLLIDDQGRRRLWRAG